MSLRKGQTRNEGVLIILLGVIGIFRILDSFDDAGQFLSRIFYTMLFIFFALILLGIQIVNDAKK